MFKINEATSQQIKKDIRNGVMCGIILLLITLVNTYILIFHANVESKTINFLIFQIIFISLCTSGMYYKNRLAAIGLILYLIIIRILKVIEGVPFSLFGFISWIIFVIFSYKAMIATFKFHKVKK